MSQVSTQKRPILSIQMAFVPVESSAEQKFAHQLAVHTNVDHKFGHQMIKRSLLTSI